MHRDVRTIALAIGALWLIAAPEALAQAPPAYYYPAPGAYATTAGTVQIPTVGYYYNVPLSAVPVRNNAAPTSMYSPPPPAFNPPGRSRNPYATGAYPYAGSFTRGAAGGVDDADPNWQFRN